MDWDDYWPGALEGRDDKVDICTEISLYLLEKAVECKSLGGVVLSRLNSLLTSSSYSEVQRQILAGPSDRRRRRLSTQITSMLLQQYVENKDLVQLVENICLSEHWMEELKGWFKGWREGVGGVRRVGFRGRWNGRVRWRIGRSWRGS